MCFIVAEGRGKHIASSPLKTYKEVLLVLSGSMVSIKSTVFEFTWYSGLADLIPDSVKPDNHVELNPVQFSVTKELVINEGYHSYAGLNITQYNRHDPADSILYKSYTVVKVVMDAEVPTGASYYTNENNEVVSSYLILKPYINVIKLVPGGFIVKRYSLEELFRRRYSTCL